MKPAPVYIVHCIDTEGPLFEPLSVKFERLEEILGVTGIPVSAQSLDLLQKEKIDLGGKESQVSKMLAANRSNTLGTWHELDLMLDNVCSTEFRNELLDSDKRGWCYNWFCMDHVGFDVNPRRRDMGFHNIFDHYSERMKSDVHKFDELHWHFHPVSTYREAHRCATHYLRSDEIYQILARRILERNWFPSVFRAGFQAERPDSHWFLEQYIPFDYTNMALDDPSEFENALDFKNGRSGDWRRAPSDWSTYHPDHDDYQSRGNCRRWIMRCLNINSRIASVDQREINKGFERAQSGLPTIIGVCSHDFRDLKPEVQHVRELIQEASAVFPDTKFYFSGALEAATATLPIQNFTPLKLKIEMQQQKNDVPSITVKTEKGEVFGPQPFLAIKIKGNKFIHDNLDFGLTKGEWSYAFHGDTLPICDVELIGVGASDAGGNVSVATLSP